MVKAFPVTRPDRHSAGEPGNRSSRTHRGGANLATILIISIALAVSYGGYRWLNTKGDKSTEGDVVLYTVARDDFVLSVTERGEIESAGVTEIRSEVKTKNSPGLAILRIVPEGEAVETGDFLVELDSSALVEEKITQQITVNTVEALVIEARNIYETAVITKREYIEGTYVQERQTIESEVFVAEENLNRAKEYHEYSKKLASKGYVNKLQLEADKFAVEKSVKELDAAKTKLQVLDKFTKEKMLKQCESDIKISKAKWEAEKNSLELEISKLREIEDQIAKCTITAPKPGTVVYAHESDHRGQDDFIVEEGAMIRERQPIIHLPDASAMRVVVKINESLIQFVKPGMPAVISPVGIVGQPLEGTVESVKQYAEPTGWRKANVKEYKAYVQINEPAAELRSGMTAAVTIQCEFVADAIKVPVQTVYPHGEDYYCLVVDDGNWEARVVHCGPTNDRFFVIKDGLRETEQVAMVPRKYLDRVDLPELSPEESQRAVQRPRLPGKKEAANRAKTARLVVPSSATNGS